MINFNIKTPFEKLQKDPKTIENSKLDSLHKAISVFLKELDANKNKKEHSERLGIINFFKSINYDTQNYKDSDFGFEENNNDLAIKHDENFEVLFETKSGNETIDMLTPENMNVKPLHQLVLYYFRERKKLNNKIKYLIVTNGYTWFIFDSNEFDRVFYRSELKKNFDIFDEKRGTATNTAHFYNDIAKPFIEKTENKIECVYFDLRNYKTKNLQELKPLYKLLSKAKLLKYTEKIDSNKLNEGFFYELLHIMGLEESSGKDTKIVAKKKPDEGSLLENVKAKIESHHVLDEFSKKYQFGKTYEEQLFSISLELVLTWVNRLLFLKLLEGQLFQYNNYNEDFRFLTTNKITDFDILDTLFFEVLNTPVEKRKENIKTRYAGIPYLNSSLFEPSILEKKIAFISSLKDNLKLKLFSGTVLTNEKVDSLPTLEYFLKFLEAYNFASHPEDEVYKEKGELINASVLGLVFEKINGYKDGSFFTPGYITEYMARKSIQSAVIQKFNDIYNLEITNFDELQRYVGRDSYKEEKFIEYNQIINSLKIVDPAVGSGHFLVSVLNELLFLKSQLGLLKSQKCFIEIDNDTVVIKEKNTGELFNYQLTEKKEIIEYKNEIQVSLFNEKKNLIESCLFGVDINPKSVQITRLRLWIELLKNSFYKKNSNNEVELETLPNIDINIKVGNSLISRFELNESLSKALQKSKWNIDSYRNAVNVYRNATNRHEKRQMVELIEEIKSNFRSEISQNDPKVKKLSRIGGEILTLTNQTSMFEMSKEEKKEWKNKIEKLTQESQKLEAEIEAIKNNKIYENAFEWRFEFPEVLDNDGTFIGFDIVIGNPPYVDYREIGTEETKYLKKFRLNYKSQRPNLYQFFIEQAYNLAKNCGVCAFINPNQFLSIDAGFGLRKFLVENTIIKYIDDVSYLKVFPKASTYTVVWSYKKEKDGNYPIRISKCKSKKQLGENQLTVRKNEIVSNGKYLIIASPNQWLILKIEKDKSKLSEYCDMFWGTSKSGYGKLKILEKDLKALSKKELEKYRPILQTRDIKRYYIDWKQEYISSEIYSDNVLKKFKEKNKLLVARMTLQLQAAIDENYSYIGKSTIVHNINSKISKKYLLAILNSKFIDFWYKNYFENTHMSGGYIRYDIPYLKKIPITEISKKQQEPIINKVDEIISLKKQNNQADTSKLETEIDEMIYKLYDLTLDEIKIIEDSFL